MFDAISPSYDALNRALSLTIDTRWRKLAARECPRGGLILDLCCGTGDLAMAVAQQTGSRVIGVDFSYQMLRLGRQKGVARCVQADGLRMPFPDATFDACSVAFGVRNLSDPRAGLTEILRVLKPGGRLVILEFSLPRTPILRSIYRFYLANVVPMIGNAFSRSRAYRYLADTVAEWHSPDSFRKLLSAAGFRDVRARPLTFGVSCVFTAVKGPESISCPPSGAWSPDSRLDSDNRPR